MNVTHTHTHTHTHTGQDGPCITTGALAAHNPHTTLTQPRIVGRFVQLTVVNRQATVSMIPAASSMILKALNEPVRDRKKTKNIVHNGNVTLDQIIDIARQMRERSMARTLAGTVKEMLGTAFSIGCTVNGESPRDMQQMIDDEEVEIPEE